MKAIGFILLALVLLVNEATSQVQQRNEYTTIVYTMRGPKVKGTLYKVHDATVEIRGRKGNIIVPIAQVLLIRVQKKGAQVTGVLVGAGVGMLVGGIIGRVSYREPEQGEWDFFGPKLPTAMGMMVGSGIGIAIGNAIGRKGYRARIFGEQKNFDEHKVNLQQYQLSVD